jgi:lipoate-protein ligase B
VSLHGAAINLTTALDAYELFVPCGLPEAPATSLAALGGDPPPMTEAGRDIAIRLASHFALGPLDGVT